jgi:hypothetical protein
VVRDALGLMRNLLVRLVPTDQLIPYIRNSRTHTDAQVALVAASMRECASLVPDNLLVVKKQDALLVST